MLRRGAIVVFGAMLASCAAAGTAPANDELPRIKDRSTLRIELVRTVCYGTCPMYGVEILGDGTVTYCGIHFVDQVGERSRRVVDADLSELVAQFHAADFLTLNDEYAATATDGPTYAVTIAYDDKSKSVIDYFGEEAGMPISVTALEDAIDRIAGTSEWIGQGAFGYASEWPACAERFGVPGPTIVFPEPTE